MPFSFGSENWKFPYLCRLESVIIGAFATAHIVSSLRYFWNELKKRRQEKAEQQSIATSLYGRVVSGECHHGWQMVLPRKMMTQNTRIQAGYWTMRAGFTSSQQSASRLDHVITTLIGGPSPDGRRIYTLRMWSLVCPEVNATMLRISCRREDWSVRYTCYLDDSTYAVLLRHPGTTRYRLLICSTYQQGPLSVRKYDLQSPTTTHATVVSVHLGSTKSRLFVQFSRYTWDDFEDDEQNAEDHDAGSQVLEYILASYDLPAADEPGNTIHYPRSYEGITIPTRNRYHVHEYYPVIGGEVISFLYNDPDTTNYVPPLCITYKPNRGWTVERAGMWTQRIRSERDSTGGTWKLLKVMRSFWRLDPPESRCWTRELPLVGKCHYGNSCGDNLFVFTRDGMFRRRINPPSLKCLAAEALFRSNPMLKRMSRLELKREIGVDVFEGIPEEKEGEHEVPLIHL